MLSRKHDKPADWWESLADALGDARDAATDRAHHVGGRLDQAGTEAQRRAVHAWAALTGKSTTPPWRTMALAAGAGFALGWLSAQAVRHRPQIEQALDTAEERARQAVTAVGDRVDRAKASYDRTVS
ncbi:MAG: hypothetical protein HOV79_23125 [Hamadaea sp.]|nr:hypothetical protein [Hamadaea sp.]